LRVTHPFYDDDLAHVHHTGYSDGLRRAIPAMLALLRAAGIPKGRVVDLGCGGGIWLRAASEAGYETVGVDVSPSFVALARETAPKAQVVGADAYAFALPPCDAITAFGEVLCYVAAASAPPLAAFVQRAASALRPGGLLLFDLVVGGDEAPAPGRAQRDGDGWAVTADATIDAVRRVLTRNIETKRGGRTVRERHLQYLFTEAEVVSALETAGFAVRTARGWGAVDLPRGRRAFVATRAAL
jgi:SAM-dependent methyltransferase